MPPEKVMSVLGQFTSLRLCIWTFTCRTVVLTEDVFSKQTEECQTNWIMSNGIKITTKSCYTHIALCIGIRWTYKSTQLKIGSNKIKWNKAKNCHQLFLHQSKKILTHNKNPEFTKQNSLGFTRWYGSFTYSLHVVSYSTHLVLLAKTEPRGVLALTQIPKERKKNALKQPAHSFWSLTLDFFPPQSLFTGNIPPHEFSFILYILRA